MSNHSSSLTSWQNVKKTALQWTTQNGNVSCICHVAKQNFTWRPTPNSYSVRHLCFSAKVKFHKKRNKVYNINILYCIYSFWVFPRHQIVVGRRFGTLCQFHLQRLDVDSEVWRKTRKFIPVSGFRTGAGRTNEGCSASGSGRFRVGGWVWRGEV